MGTLPLECAWEGPRGGLCHNEATVRVHSGEYDPHSSYYSAWSCPEHVNHFRGEVVRVTGIDAIVSERVS